MNQPSLRQFKQRIALRCDLNPLTPQETLGYLAGRIRAAGGVASRVFSREAATLLHTHSGGVPRVINVLADNSLLAAFGRQSKQVTSALVAEVAEDFNLSRTAPATAPGDAATSRTDARQNDAPSARAAPVTQVSLLAVPDVHPEKDSSPQPAEEETGATGTSLFKGFSAARRFPFLGRRGTA